MTVCNGRRAGLQGSPREGLESGRKRAFHCERGVAFTALSRRSYSSSERKSSATRAPSCSRWPRSRFEEPVRRGYANDRGLAAFSGRINREKVASVMRRSAAWLLRQPLRRSRSSSGWSRRLKCFPCCGPPKRSGHARLRGVPCPPRHPKYRPRSASKAARTEAELGPRVGLDEALVVWCVAVQK
jgi:hypothetical protein